MLRPKTWFKFPIQIGRSRDDIIDNVKFQQYRDVLNYYRTNVYISCCFYFLITGRAESTTP